MTSVGVISSVMVRIKRLKEVEVKDHQEMPLDYDEVLKHLTDIKDLLAKAYVGRREAEAEVQIKEAVRLSYEIVNAIADSFKAVKTGTKNNVKELVEKLKAVQGGLTGKISPDRVSDSAPLGITEPEAKDKTKEGFLGIALARLGKLGGTTKNEKNSSGSDSDPVVGSKAPVLVSENLEIGISSDTQVENTEQKSSSSGTALIEIKAAGLEQKPEISTSGSSEIQIQEKEDRKRLMDRIKEDLLSDLQKDDLPREVYIVGESGMGKTTVARKLYNDDDIQDKFKVSGWVTVGHNFQIKGVLQLLLQQLQGGQHEQQADSQQMNEMELIAQIFSVLEDKSYLLVLQDVASIKDWESISLALPLANSTRVIITTSSNEFLSCASKASKYQLSSLTQSETLVMLNKRATIFSKEIGKAILDITGGSPLYTRILGRSLEPEAKNPDHDLIGELDTYKLKKGTPQVLDISYRRLGHELKPCFVYLGLFPPGQDIHVDKLYLLLSAENLIPPSTDSEESLQKSFSNCMDKLADLKLVKVVEDELASRIGFHKSCTLHDQVHDYCISKGLDEEFIEVVDFKRPEQVVVRPETRRLAVHMRNYRGESSISFKGGASVKNKILSLLVFDALSGQGKPGWPLEISDLSGFTHLRALNFEEVDFRVRKPPKGIAKIALLRFLSFRGCFLEELPSDLSSLTQLETLDLLVQHDCCVIIPSDIFTNMKRMEHLFLPRLYRGKDKKTKPSLLGLKMMETLINFDTEVFDVEDLRQLEKLKILSTISNGDYPEHVNAVINLLKERRVELRHSSMEIRNFDCYNGASILALKELLQCRFLHSIEIEGEIGELPEEGDSNEGDESLVSEMVLRGSELEDDPMGYLGRRFQKLRSIVLADDAFMGTKITISSSTKFPKLRSLKLRNLQYLEKLTIEEGAVPELSSLQIESCGDDLELTIPEKLHNELKNSTRDDAYKVVPSPSIFNTTPLSTTKVDGGKETAVSPM